MSFRVEFLDEALEEAEEATRFYEGCVAELGTRFRRELEAICTSIARKPLHWNQRAEGHRRVNFRGFPYYVAFFIRGDRIVIAAIGHASRDPEYWRERKF